MKTELSQRTKEQMQDIKSSIEHLSYQAKNLKLGINILERLINQEDETLKYAFRYLNVEDIETMINSIWEIYDEICEEFGVNKEVNNEKN
jgi:archaellum component FlaC